MYKIVLVAASLLPLALANGYEEHGYEHGGGGHGYGKHDDHYPPQPYKFGYDVKDGYGGTLNQKEEGDSHGNKKGSYGYTDAYGIYRQVDYVADKHGFRATVKTNEPGTANQNPADVYMHSSAGEGHYGGGHESGHYKAASYLSPSYAPAAPKSVYAPVIKVAAPVYKAPVNYALPKALYKSSGYGPIPTSAVYPLPMYSENY